MSKPLTFFCVSFFFKGEDFLRAIKAAGNTVYLLTKKSLENEPWPRESVDEFFYMEDDHNSPENIGNIGRGVAWLLRSRKIDRIVALDDFDVEKAAYLREEFRIPGMGQTTARHFRDKLAMRTKAAEAGIRVPAFSALFNDEAIHEFTQTVSPPWVVKPRGEASATGIKKVHDAEQLWRVLEEISDDRHRYLIEQFRPGDVYHVDSLCLNGKVLFSRVSQYLSTPFEVAHGGGIFRTLLVEFGSPDDLDLQRFNEEVLIAFGMQFSASHTEFIKSKEDGQFYFLETSSRVGGAHIANMLEIATGINMWTEWARIEHAMAYNLPYKLPPTRTDYAGILISLARQEYPDSSQFNDPEIVWRLQKRHHVGLILRSDDRRRILDLLDEYAVTVARDYLAVGPPKDKPTH